MNSGPPDQSPVVLANTPSGLGRGTTDHKVIKLTKVGHSGEPRCFVCVQYVCVEY